MRQQELSSLNERQLVIELSLDQLLLEHNLSKLKI